MHAVGIWCKTKIQIDPGGLEVNFSLQVQTPYAISPHKVFASGETQ